MRKAKLIKQKEWQSENQKEWPDQPDKAQPRENRTAVETAQEWVRERQTTKRLSPRQRFAALFS